MIVYLIVLIKKIIKVKNTPEKEQNISNLSSENGENFENNNINTIQNKIKLDLKKFKLKEAKSYLKIYENEIMNGKEFELNCKRILKIMMIFIQRDNYIIFNPSKIPIQKLIN